MLVCILKKTVFTTMAIAKLDEVAQYDDLALRMVTGYKEFAAQHHYWSRTVQKGNVYSG